MKLALQIHPTRITNVTLSQRIFPVFETLECEYSVLPRSHDGNIELEPGTDLICSIGGDGTFIHGSRVAVRHGIPIIGVRAGRLGFLCSTKLSDLYQTIAEIKAGRMPLEERYLLRGRLIIGGKAAYEQVALNEIVLSRKQTDKLRDFEAYTNGNLIANYRGDGILVGTPLGSTAYNMSAGGPLVHPSIEVILVTPICAHSLFTKPLVLPQDDMVEIVSRGGHAPLMVSFDGEFQQPLEDGDCVQVTGHDVSLKLYRPAEYDFFQVLREKFQFGYVYGGSDD